MSWTIRLCSKCGQPCRCEGAGAFPPGTDVTYGVAWRCDPCDFRSLDVCPVGPLVPRPGTCLNCGSPSAGLCEACGMGAAEIEAMVQQACPDAGALSDTAVQCAQQGLFRLAFHLLDTRLRAHPGDGLAWSRKAALLSTVGLPSRAIATLDAALQHVAPSERPEILHVRAHTLCQLERAEEALRDIDEALLSGPEVASRHYVRGWALGMLGRLQEALECMERVLALDPNSASAQRGKAMIQSALSRVGEA